MGRRPYYAEFANHCLRFYLRNVNLNKFNTLPDKLNWEAAMKAMKNLSEIEKAMLKDIYTSYDTMADSVYHVAKKLQIDQEVIWTLINEVSYRVVRNRGLI